MINIFRKLRRKENGFTRYLLYAIGEIVLIIIGIYCAIQLNNWNEGKKEDSAIEALMDKYESELYLTIRNADWDLKNGVVYDSLIQAILNDRVSLEDYWENGLLEQMINKTFTLDPARDNLEKILLKEEKLPRKYDSVIHDIKRASFWMDREPPLKKSFWESAERNTNFINATYTWAPKTDSLMKLEAYNYFLTSEEHQKRMYSHWHHMRMYLREIHDYRRSAISLLVNLKINRENLDEKQLRNFLDEFKLEELEVVDCSFIPKSGRLKGGVNTFLANLGSETVRLRFYDHEDKITRVYNLGPGQSRFTRTQWAQQNDKKYYYLDLLNGDSCRVRYPQTMNGYIIFN